MQADRSHTRTDGSHTPSQRTQPQTDRDTGSGPSPARAGADAPPGPSTAHTPPAAADALQPSGEGTAARALVIAERFLSRWRDAFTSSGADDLAQEAVLAVLRRRDTVRRPDRFAAFVRTVSRRCRSRALARHLRLQMASLDADLDLAEQLVVDRPRRATLNVAGRRVPMDWCLRALDEVLAGLGPVNSRIVLSFYEGFSMVELAQRYALSEDSLKVRLYRCRQRVRRELEDRVESARIAGLSVPDADRTRPRT